MRSHSFFWLALGGLTAVLSAEDALEARVQKIFKQNCASCHDKGSTKRPKGGVSEILDMAKVAKNLKLVEPGFPETSEIFQQVESGNMPPDRGRKLNADEKAAVRDWILELGKQDAVAQAARQAEARQAQSEAAQALSLPVELSRAGLRWAVIPAGSAWIGSPEGERGGWKNQERRKFSLSAPLLFKTTEVTRGEWASVMSWDAAKEADAKLPMASVTWFDALVFCNRLSESEGIEAAYALTALGAAPDGLGKDALDLHPLLFKAWDLDANGLLGDAEVGGARDRASLAAAELRLTGQRGFRLPTESEWEYAARALSETPFSFGRRIDAEKARFAGVFDFQLDETALSGPWPVGSAGANAFGLFDMHGNVAEWCHDPFSKARPPVQDPWKAEETGLRAIRGGGYRSHGAQCRSAARTGAAPSLVAPDVGFRPVLELRP